MACRHPTQPAPRANSLDRPTQPNPTQPNHGGKQAAEGKRAPTLRLRLAAPPGGIFVLGRPDKKRPYGRQLGYQEEERSLMMGQARFI